MHNKTPDDTFPEQKSLSLFEDPVNDPSNDLTEITILRREKEDLKKRYTELKTVFENINEVLFPVDMLSYQVTQTSGACEKVALVAITDETKTTITKPTFMNKISLVFYFTLILAVGISNPAAAQKKDGIEESLQEFFIGETVYAQEKKEIQFTLKPAYWKKEGLEMINIPLQLEYGFTDRFQVELQLPYYYLPSKNGQTINGMGNLEVGFLYNVLKGNEPFALSLALDIGLPTANKEKEIDEAEVEWEPSLIVAKQIGKAQVHASLGAEITKRESSFNYNLATVVPFGNWRATLELTGKINEKLIYLTPGVVWKGIDGFEFGVGFSKSSIAWGVILMATHEFSLLKKNKQPR